MANESITFRIGHLRQVAEKIGFENLVSYQLSPGAPYIYCEKNVILTSKDIIEAKVSQDIHCEDYWVEIQFTESAYNKLNSLIKRGLRNLVLFIKGVPFYTLGLSGPFDTPTVLLGPKNDKDEVDLLMSNLSD